MRKSVDEMVSGGNSHLRLTPSTLCNSRCENGTNVFKMCPHMKTDKMFPSTLYRFLFANTKSSPSSYTEYKKVSFSNCSTLESVFKKFRFRGSFYADTSVVVLTEGLTVTIKLSFQIYPA